MNIAGGMAAAAVRPGRLSAASFHATGKIFLRGGTQTAHALWVLGEHAKHKVGRTHL